MLREAAHSSDRIQQQIVELLHRAGDLNLYAIAKNLDQAPFRIRAELHALRRRRIVYDRYALTEHLWSLSDTGHRIANSYDQTEIPL